MTMSSKRKRNVDKLSEKVCAGLRPADKQRLRKLKNKSDTTYAELIRTALQTCYPDVFKE